MKTAPLLTLLLISLLGNLPVAASAQPYVISTDGSEVTDQKTGLIWRRCSEGMYWNSVTCVGVADTFTYHGALQYAANQTGYAGEVWRVPEVQEHKSIVDMDSNLDLVNGVKLAATDLSIFPETPASWFWSASHARSNPENAVDVDFYDGLAGKDVGSDVNKHYHVRLVRSVR